MQRHILILITCLLAVVAPAQNKVPKNVPTIYVDAGGVMRWSRDETYYVADFIQNGFDTKVWFNSEAQWEMKQIDWGTMDEVLSVH